MWLLDANMPLQLVVLLRELGVDTDSAMARGWSTLSNGRLVEVAVQAGFSVLLTRDRLFERSAVTALTKYPKFCVVRVTLPQARGAQFLSAFRSAWQKMVIVPTPGQMIEWPPK